MVSIIIPTYKRYELLGRTLDSIIDQTYENWECMVIDDHSRDYILELMEFYREKDSRIKFYRRPLNVKKGANSCRNFGFEHSRGEYIQFFDSDDIMTPNALQVKINTIREFEVDYVISRTLNFQDPDPKNIISRNENYYRFKEYELNNYNYVTQKINWLTYDFLGRREVVEKVRFNENLNSLQERNFFSKLTCYSVDAEFINRSLTKRRIHSKSIQSGIRSNKGLKELAEQDFFFETWKEISQIRPCSNSDKYLLLKLIELDKKKPLSWRVQKGIWRVLIKQMRLQELFLISFYKNFFYLTGRGYFLRNYIYRNLHSAN